MLEIIIKRNPLEFLLLNLDISLIKLFLIGASLHPPIAFDDTHKCFVKINIFLGMEISISMFILVEDQGYDEKQAENCLCR